MKWKREQKAKVAPAPSPTDAAAAAPAGSGALTVDQWRERVKVLKGEGDEAAEKLADTMGESSKGGKHNAMVFNEQLRRLEDWVTQMTKTNALLNSLFVDNIKHIKKDISIMKQQEQEQEDKLEQHRQRLLALERSVDESGAAEEAEAARINAEKARIQAELSRQADDSRTQEAPAARATSTVPEADDGLGPLYFGGGKVIDKSKRKKKSKKRKNTKKRKMSKKRN